MATATSGLPPRLSILFYHRVLDKADPLLPDIPDLRLFDVHMRTLARYFRVVSLDEGVSRLREGRLRSRSVCITFDDGYADNLTHAIPILRRYRLTSSFFIATSFLDGGRMFCDTVIEAVRRFGPGPIDLTWFGLGHRAVADRASRLRLIDDLDAWTKYRDLDQRREGCERLEALAGTRLPDDLMLRTDQLVRMHREGMSIGGHTSDHPILRIIPAEQARAQIAGNRAALTAITGEAPRFFAYPNGKPGIDYTRQHVEMVRQAGYSGALTTAHGAARPDADLFQLPRISAWQPSALRVVAGLTRTFCSRRECGVLAAAEP